MKRFLYALFAILISVLISCGGGGGGVDNAIEDDSFTIGYNANGAESGTAPRVQTGTNGSSLLISANTGNLAKNGYLFDGWNTASDGSGADYTPGAPYFGKNIILYAKWARIFNYHVIGGGSPSPALDGAQHSPALPSASITGLTAKGQTLSDIDIPESIDGYTVSDIGENAFRNCDNIANVTIPDTVTNIGDNAFNGCSNMHDMTLLGTVPPAIGAGVFISCTMIINVPQTAVGTYQGTAGWTIYSTNIVYIGASTYSIVYDGNGADGGIIPLMQVSLTGGYPLEVYDNIGDLTRAGCTFSGWNTSPDGKGLNFAAGKKFSGPGRLTLYAKWTHPDYTVTFDGQGADTPANPSSQHVIAPANTVVLPEAPIRAGYTFVGWYTETNGQGTRLTSSTIIYGNMTVYAKWNEGIFQITYNANGATSGSVPSSQKSVTNNNVTISGNTGNLQKTGCFFGCWNTKADGSGTDYAVGSFYSGPRDIMLYARWLSYVDKDDLKEGDIVLQNGKYVSYSLFKDYATQFMAISQPAGIVAYRGSTGNYGTTGRIYMVGLNQGNDLEWAPRGTVGYNTKFNTSSTAGEGNWSVITAIDNTASTNAATNYPMFNYANTYSVTGFLSGWFLPSIDELKILYTNSTTISNSIAAITGAGGTATIQLPGAFYSSTQAQAIPDAPYYVRGYTFYNNTSDKFFSHKKDEKNDILVVRALD